MSQLAYTNLVDGDKPTASGFNTRYLLAINLLNSGVETDNIAALAVTTAKIANNAVDGTKIAMGSDAQGDVLYYDGTNYARLGAGTSGQFLQTQGAAANPQWASTSSTNSRTDLLCVQASSATITVGMGSADVNGVQSKTTSTTLTLTTAGDWAGGSSLQATDTYGYIGMDSSGNLKLHTTAPTHDDFGVSTTAGIKRYATWSGTVYRIIGWFYMNSTGSGELDTYGVSNLKDGGVFNSIVSSSTTQISLNDTSYGTDLDATEVKFYSSGKRPVLITCSLHLDTNEEALDMISVIDVDGTDKTASEMRSFMRVSSGDAHSSHTNQWQEILAEGTHTIKVQGKVGQNTSLIESFVMRVEEI